MNTKKRTIIGILAMTIVLAVSAGSLFGCEKSDDDGKDSGKKQIQKADDDDYEKPVKKSKKGDKDDDDDKKPGKNSYESLVDDFMEAYKELDAKKMAKLMPEEVFDWIAENQYDGDKAAMIEELQKSMDETREQLEEQGIKLSEIKYEIIDVEDSDEDDIKEMNEELENEGVDLKIKEDKTIKIEITVPSEDDDETRTVELEVILVENSWYMVSFDEG